MYKKVNLLSMLILVGFCIGLCACHADDIERANDTKQVNDLKQQNSFQEMSQEKTDFVTLYDNFCEQENADQIALIYLDGDSVPELLIRREREYELYYLDGSAVRPISMPDEQIRANTYGPKYVIEELRDYRTLYWFEYVPREGLVRVHGSDEDGRKDYYLRYVEGALYGELEVSGGTSGWKTYEADQEIGSEEFRSRLTELGYDGLIPCAYLYDNVEAAYENMDVRTDSRKILEDFVNGKTDALCYEEAYSGQGIPTKEGLFLRNYEDIYEDITCGETWWGSLIYVDFDNDGQDELVMGGYTNSRMFFDVIGDTVYEVLHTCSTTDVGHVSELNGKNVIERTDLLHGNRQCYEIMEYDACCSVVDWFLLCANFEGERYTAKDRFEYRDREITMEEYRAIVDSIHSPDVEDRVLDYWVGEYEFSESVREPVLMVMDYRMKIFRENGKYYADIEIDGQLTMARIRAEAGLESGGDRIELKLKEYLSEHVIGGTDAAEGDVLLTLERKDGKILTVWGAITPMLHENEESERVYFVKKSEGKADSEQNGTAQERTNEYFFQDIGQLPEYEIIGDFSSAISGTASLSIMEVDRIGDGTLYFIRIVHDSETSMDDMRWDSAKQEYILTDRRQLGYFYVTPDAIWRLQGEDVLSNIEKEEDIFSLGTLICSREATADPIGDAKGWHEYIEIDGDRCIWHGWNDLVETGFYERFEWQEGKGLTEYRSGYGAGSMALEIFVKSQSGFVEEMMFCQNTFAI